MRTVVEYLLLLLRGAVAPVHYTGTKAVFSVHMDTSPPQSFWALEPGSVAYSCPAIIVQEK